MSEYIEPIDVPDAQWKASTLEQEIDRIEQQLADPKRKFERGSGRALSEVDYQSWKFKADEALYHKKLELGFLTAWLQRKGVIDQEPARELMIAMENAIPVLLSSGQITHHPAIERLLTVFEFITGAFRRQ